MCPSDDDERYVLDSCVVIDFCGRTDNLPSLMSHVADAGVITSAVLAELERWRLKKFPLLAQFLDLVTSGTVEVIDPDLTDETAARIVSKWSQVFGAGEVSSAALAASRRWVFVSRDIGPMRQLRISESILMETTADVLNSLLRRRAITKPKAAAIEAATKKRSPRSGRK